MVEFALSSIVFVPVILGALVFGFNLVRAVQLSQLCRETTHMFAYGVDFTQSQNAAILARLASPLSIVAGGGPGAVVLSKITLVTTSDCQAAGLSACANTGKYVFTSFFVFGNPQSSLAQTRLGNPSSSYVLGTQTITQTKILTDATLQATNFPTSMFYPNTTQPGQYTYTGEVALQTQGLTSSTIAGTISYVRSFF